MPACPSAPCFSPEATGSVPLLRDLLSAADVTRLHNFGWCHKIEIEEGVKRLYQWYCQSINPSI